jgi:hypothetical protein
MKERGPFSTTDVFIHEKQFFYLSATVACLTGSELTGSGAQVTAMRFGALHLINMYASQSVDVDPDPVGSRTWSAIRIIIKNSIPASSDTVESEGRQMKQRWKNIQHIPLFIINNCPVSAILYL